MVEHATSPSASQISEFLTTFVERLGKEVEDEGWELDVEAAAGHQYTDQCKAHRDFVGDNLRGRTQCTHHRVLGVRGPAGDDHAVDADRGQRQYVQQAGVEVRQHHAAVERYYSPGRQRRADRQDRREQEQEAARIGWQHDFLEHQFDRIRNRLQPATRADTVRADADLDVADDLALGIGRVGHREHQRQHDQNDLGDDLEEQLPARREPVPEFDACIDE